MSTCNASFRHSTQEQISPEKEQELDYTLSKNFIDLIILRKEFPSLATPTPLSGVLEILKTTADREILHARD